MRKRLLKESSGEYVLFLDGDDYYCYEDFVVEFNKTVQAIKEYETSL